MNIQRFEAPDMPTALREVHRALGPEAVILEAKPRSRADGRPGVVVLAALDRHAASGASPAAAAARRVAASAPAPSTHLQALAQASARSPRAVARRAATPERAAVPWAESIAAVARSAVARPAAAAAEPFASPAESLVSAGAGAEVARLREQVRHLSGLVASDHFSRLPQGLRELYSDLVAAEVDANLAFALLGRLAQAARGGLPAQAELAPLRRLLHSLLPAATASLAARPGEKVLVAGPAGAGKTLVAAALAVAALRRGLRPGLLSIDAFRAGGAAALEPYARALGIPYGSAFDPSELTAAHLPGFGGCNVLLIDTPALARGEEEPGLHIRRFQEALGGTRTIVVLPATAKVRDLLGMLELGTPLAPEGLIFTRLDETAARGGLLSLSVKSRLPICGVTLGREIASALREASSEEIVTWALGAAREVRAADPVAPAARELAPRETATIERAWTAPTASRAARLGLAG